MTCTPPSLWTLNRSASGQPSHNLNTWQSASNWVQQMEDQSAATCCLAPVLWNQTLLFRLFTVHRRHIRWSCWIFATHLKSLTGSQQNFLLAARQWRKSGSDPKWSWFSNLLMPRHKSFWLRLHGFTCLLLAESVLAHVCCPRFLHPKSLDLRFTMFHIHFHGTHVGQTRLQYSTLLQSTEYSSCILSICSDACPRYCKLLEARF